MKIVFVTMQLGPGYTQGTERYVSTLSEGLRRRGHEVKCLAGDPLGRYPLRNKGDKLDSLNSSGPVSPSAATGGAESAAVGNDRCSTGLAVKDGEVHGVKDIARCPTFGWMTIAGRWGQRAARWLQAERPDVVHVANPAHVGVGVMDVCRRLGIPVVVTTMDFWWICPKSTLLRPDGSTCDGTPGWRECVRCMAADHPRSRLRWLGRLPEALSPVTLALYLGRGAVRGMPAGDMLAWPKRRRLLAERLDEADAVIFPSAATRDLIRPQLGHDRWRQIPYGLSEEWFQVDARRPPRGAAATGRPAPPEALTIGYAGAMLPHKGPHLLLEAVRLLGWSRTLLRLAGPLNGDAYEQALREKARGLNVEFLGRVEPGRMPDFYRSLDVLVMPSTWPENLPFVVLEAWAAGVPVVASRVAGVADQVPDKNLLFEAGSAHGLAVALSHARECPGTRGLGRVHSVDEMTNATQELYDTLVGCNV